MKKFLYSLFILFFVLTGCKGAYSPVDSNEVKLVNVKFANDNARYVSYYQENNNLKYEVTVYDANGDFYKLYDKQPFPSYEEFREIVMQTPEVLEMEGSQARENEVISADEPVIIEEYSEASSFDDIPEEELKAAYERLKSENSYYRSPYQFNIVLPEGKYTFVMEAYGNEEGYNKDVLLLKGETTAEIKQLSDNRDEIGPSFIHIKLEEVETEIETGNVYCNCFIYGVFESDYYFRYTTASDYEKNGNNSSWKSSKDNQDLKITQTGDLKESTEFSIKLFDLQPETYVFQFVFTFNKTDEKGDNHEYVSYFSEIAEVRPGLTTTARFDSSNITQFGEVTLYSVLADTNNVNQFSTQKYSYCNSFTLNSPYEYGYEFAGWYDDGACTQESSKVQYRCYSNKDHTYVYFNTYEEVKEAIKSGDYETYYYPGVNDIGNRCSGDFSLYAKMVKTEVVAEEDDPESPYDPIDEPINPEDEFVTISGTWILKNFQGGDISNYDWRNTFNIQIMDSMNTPVEIAQPDIAANDYSLSTIYKEDICYQTVVLNYKLNRTLFTDDLSTYSVIINFYLQESGKTVDLVDTVTTTLDNSVMSVDKEVEYIPSSSGGDGTGGYTITSTVQNLIDNGNYPVEGNVYSISTITEFNQMALWTNGKGGDNNYYNKNITYVLTETINADGLNVNKVGSSSLYPFNCIFDGQGYEILNISLSDKTGLFAFVGNTTDEGYAEIKNLHVSGTLSNSESNIQSGGIVGCAQGKVKITNCTSEVTVTSTNAGDCGGICGKVIDVSSYTDVQICNCINLGDITGTKRIGGIVGNVYAKTSIVNCANLGKITFTSDLGGGLVGGVYCPAGYEIKLNLMQNCYNVGEVYSELEDNINYGSIIGGESAYNETATTAQLAQNVSYCYYSPYACAASVACEENIEGINELENINELTTILNENISLLNADYSSLCKKWSTIKTVSIKINDEDFNCPLFE